MVDNKDIVLLAEAGGTKIDWALLVRGEKNVSCYTTEGANIMVSSPEKLENIFLGLKSMTGETTPGKIDYYGAGCSTPESCSKVKEAFRKVWGDSEVNVEGDMLGAARGLMGSRPGLVAILGTGSNICLYDGKRVSSPLPSLGYLLGDEGSGGAIGKRVLRELYQGRVSPHLKGIFEEETGLSYRRMLNELYSSPRPNTYMGQFAHFVAKHIEEPDIEKLVEEELEEFFDRQVIPICNLMDESGIIPSDEISFSGSVAFHFRPQLEKVAGKFGIGVGEVLKSPLKGLIEYTRSKW